MSLEGLLVIDKPVGPTSHDVVARVRRILGEPRIGHTGTLDPMASGVLPLVIGRATRLAQFYTQSDKVYEAVIRFGFATDTYDAQGQPTGAPVEGSIPSREGIERALDAFRGTFLQKPPAFSAKKIDGRRSYRLARAHRRASAVQPGLPVIPALPAEAALPTPPALPVSPPLPAQSAARPALSVLLAVPPTLPASVRVTASSLEMVGTEGDLVFLRITCSSGFYVRSLAHDLGQALGIGGHLAALRRTEASGRTLADAVPLAAMEAGAEGVARARAALIPLSAMLPALPSLALSSDGVRRAASGCRLGPDDVVGAFPRHPNDSGTPGPVKLLDPAGNLVSIAESSSSSGLLHPVVVLM